ncbi:BlaI/MecI/CopY family transcriptional regulator [bacterium]|nr:BlaI/MecI/CopY family transcriptional regulator [bacterium]
MGTLEIEIMNAIWTMLEMDDNRNIAISDVMFFLQSNGCERAYTTIKTVMDRLVSKGILARYKNGRKFFYLSTVSRFEATMMSVQKVSNQFFNGNFSDMIKFIEQNCETFVMA